VASLAVASTAAASEPQHVRLPRFVLAVLTILLLSSGCAGSGQRDLVRALAEGGCGGVPAVEYQQLASRVVLSVSVQECVVAHFRRTGELMGLAEAARVMARAIWSTPAQRFDSVMVTVYRTADEPGRTRSQSVLIEREQLTADFGPRDAALDTPRLLDVGGRTAWTFLPLVASLVGTLLLVSTARAIRAGCVLPIVIIRK
jgi:hypothetical protein